MRSKVTPITKTYLPKYHSFCRPQNFFCNSKILQRFLVTRKCVKNIALVFILFGTLVIHGLGTRPGILIGHGILLISLKLSVIYFAMA